MSAHTPTPWRVITRANHVQRRYIVVGGPGNRPIDTECNEADAAHIVRCVNAHDELVAALRAVTEKLEELDSASARTGFMALPEVIQARAALAKAEAA